MLRYFTTFVLLFAYMNFCEVDILFPFIDIKKLRLKPAKKLGQSHIVYKSGSHHVVPSSF